uniref:Uncharacterized protein n=1 Tax=Monodelphis domestica TaxID=13616 RepID=A0A5F8GUU5_MONDO
MLAKTNKHHESSNNNELGIACAKCCNMVMTDLGVSDIIGNIPEKTSKLYIIILNEKRIYYVQSTGFNFF